MRIFIFLILLFASNLMTAQDAQLDSILFYNINEGGAEILTAKSYWKYDERSNISQSEYYILNQSKKYEQINSQQIIYHKKTDKYASLVNYNYNFNQVDSTIYTYDESIFLKEKEKYNRAIGEANYKLLAKEIYTEKDFQNNNQRVIKKQFATNNQLPQEVIYHYDYVYDKKERLIEKTELSGQDTTKLQAQFKQKQSFYKNGKVKKIEILRYDTATKSFLISERHHYKYRKGKRYWLKQNIDAKTDEITRNRLIVNEYLSDGKRLLTETYFENKKPKGLPFRINRYYYSKK